MDEFPRDGPSRLGRKLFVQQVYYWSMYNELARVLSFAVASPFLLFVRFARTARKLRISSCGTIILTIF